MQNSPNTRNENELRLPDLDRDDLLEYALLMQDILIASYERQKAFMPDLQRIREDAWGYRAESSGKLKRLYMMITNHMFDCSREGEHIPRPGEPPAWFK